MTHIHLITKMKAPIDNVFDNSRSIDLHINSASKSKEKAIAGTVSGLISLNETVTWSGVHFGFRLQHTSKITEFEYPNYFVDEMILGHFKSFKHLHVFSESNGITTMEDYLEYETPFGVFGRIFDKLVLENYLVNFLQHRNTVLKKISETNAAI